MKARTFEEVWRDLEKLEGKTVYTLVNHKRNDIKKVESTGITRRAETGEEDYHINKSDFKKVWKILTEKEYCGINKSGPFVFACMAFLQEIEFTKNPYALWLSEKRHEFGKPVEKI